jgi:hypothetical protein
MSDAFKPNAELGAAVDPLVARYLEASAIENALPKSNVRANVLARAQAIAIAQTNTAVGTGTEQRNITPLRKIESKRWWQIGAANDARWQWSAAAALIAVGVTGWLNYQWTNPDSWQPESRSTTVASSPAPSSAPVQSAANVIEPPKPEIVVRETAVTDSIAAATSAKKMPESPAVTSQLQVAQAPSETKAKAQSSSANNAEKERVQVATQSSESSVVKTETADRRRESARDLDAAAAAPTIAAAPARSPSPAVPSARESVAALAPPPPAAPAAPPVAAAAPTRPDAAFGVLRDEPVIAMADSQKRSMRSAAPSAETASAGASAPMAATVSGTASTAVAAPSASSTRQPADAIGRAGGAAQAKTRSNATDSLSNAVRSGTFADISEAITQGGDVNARMEDGTPLIVFAAKRGDIGAVEQLLRAKARSNVVDTSGKTALDYARARGDVRMIELLNNR